MTYRLVYSDIFLFFRENRLGDPGRTCVRTYVGACTRVRACVSERGGARVRACVRACRRAWVGACVSG